MESPEETAGETSANPQSNKQLEECILDEPLPEYSRLQRRADGNIHVINLHRKSERGGM